ncbi:hypothetical protein [Curvivirga sp.]|uniref:hypothetical protein n=1 Tax=Curvivirga sp. TaxID=2856848 RepID=UPI003B5ADBAC
MLSITGFDVYSNINNQKTLKSPLVSADDILVDTGFNSLMSDHEKEKSKLSYMRYSAPSSLSNSSEFLLEEESGTAEQLAEIYSNAAYRENAITVISLKHNKPGSQVDFAI